MKDCNHFINLFSDFLDDIITPKDKINLQEHLHNCANCQAQFDDLRSMKKSLAALPRVKTSSSFDVVLHAKIRQDMRNKRSSNWSFSLFDLKWKAPAYAMVAIVLMFFGARIERFSSSQLNTTADERIVVENTTNGKVNIIKPGYLVVSDVDSAKNTVRVVNYPDVDRAATIADFEKSRFSDDYNGQLPNLKGAPQNTARLRQTRLNQPKIKQVEFVF